MNAKRFDVIIIGGGAIGAATLHFLAKRGITNTLLVEQRSQFARGATGSWASLLHLYCTLDFYNQYSSQALQYYRDDFEQDTGTDPGFLTTGNLHFIKPDENPKFHSSFAQIKKKTNYPLEILDTFEGTIKFPEFQWFDGEVAVYEPMAGMVCPYRVIDAWLNSATQHGAQAQKNQKVVEILTSGNQVQGIRCENGDVFYCNELILACGPWTNILLKSLDIQLPIVIRPKQVNRFELPKSYAMQQLPFFLDAGDDSFGRPMPDGSFLGGYYIDDYTCTSQFRQPLSIHQAAEAKRKLAKRLKWLRTASLIGGIRVMESYTLEEKPFLDYANNFANLFVAAGWSCTGFALAPLFAKTIAQRVQQEFKQKIKKFENYERVELCI